MNIDSTSKALALHKKLRGKIRIHASAPLTPENLALLYTPGVGEISTLLASQPELAGKLTIKGSTVAVVSDGSAVLGLGNVGPVAALPVMEGKAMLFSELAAIDAFPICLDTQDPEEIVAAVLAIAPAFAGINLEDIAAPKCFDIEKSLQEKLTIPVMHDDQHATAIVVLAGLINALKVVSKQVEKVRIVVYGAGAAGSGVANLLQTYGAKNLIIVDSKGILSSARADLDTNKTQLLGISNSQNIVGNLATALVGADVVVGLTTGGTISQADIGAMAKNPIVFAMANPQPEIMPEDALSAGAGVVATGRSDFANQLNNVLVFPGLFKGLIESGVAVLTDHHKILAARALAGLVEKVSASEIIPSVFDSRVVPAVAAAVASARKA